MRASEPVRKGVWRAGMACAALAAGTGPAAFADTSSPLRLDVSDPNSSLSLSVSQLVIGDASGRDTVRSDAAMLFPGLGLAQEYGRDAAPLELKFSERSEYADLRLSVGGQGGSSKNLVTKRLSSRGISASARLFDDAVEAGGYVQAGRADENSASEWIGIEADNNRLSGAYLTLDPAGSDLRVEASTYSGTRLADPWDSASGASASGEGWAVSVEQSFLEDKFDLSASYGAAVYDVDGAEGRRAPVRGEAVIIETALDAIDTQLPEGPKLTLRLTGRYAEHDANYRNLTQMYAPKDKAQTEWTAGLGIGDAKINAKFRRENNNLDGAKADTKRLTVRDVSLSWRDRKMTGLSYTAGVGEETARWVPVAAQVPFAARPDDSRMIVRAGVSGKTGDFSWRANHRYAERQGALSEAAAFSEEVSEFSISGQTAEGIDLNFGVQRKRKRDGEIIETALAPVAALSGASEDARLTYSARYTGFVDSRPGVDDTHAFDANLTWVAVEPAADFAGVRFSIGYRDAVQPEFDDRRAQAVFARLTIGGAKAP